VYGIAHFFGRLLLRSPLNPDFGRILAEDLGARRNSTAKAWQFEMRDQADVLGVERKCHGRAHGR